MALKLPQPKDYKSVPLEDVELTKSIRATLAETGRICGESC